MSWGVGFGGLSSNGTENRHKPRIRKKPWVHLTLPAVVVSQIMCKRTVLLAVAPADGVYAERPAIRTDFRAVPDLGVSGYQPFGPAIARRFCGAGSSLGVNGTASAAREFRGHHT